MRSSTAAIVVIASLLWLTSSARADERNLLYAENAYKKGLEYSQNEQWVLMLDRAEYCEDYAGRALTAKPELAKHKPAGSDRTGQQIADACQELKAAAIKLKSKHETSIAGEQARQTSAGIAEDVAALVRAEGELAKGRKAVVAKKYGKYNALPHFESALSLAQRVVDSLPERVGGQANLATTEIEGTDGKKRKAKDVLAQATKARDAANAEAKKIRADASKQADKLKAEITKQLKGDRARVIKQEKRFPSSMTGWKSTALTRAEALGEQARTATQYEYNSYGASDCAVVYTFRGDKLANTKKSSGCR